MSMMKMVVGISALKVMSGQVCQSATLASNFNSELGSVMKKLGENPTENQLLELVNKFDEDGNGTIEFSEFLIMMTTKVKMESICQIILISSVQAKEAEIEESENFIPCCFRSLRDRHGPTLKVLFDRLLLFL